MSVICSTKAKVTQNETWSDIFSAFGTEAKSNIFMKQLTTICISTILHLRKILPDGYFESKPFEGMSLKLLKLGVGYSYANKINDWLEGAFEAIDKKYLKHLMLDIKDRDSKLTLEIYTITFIYKKGNEAVNVLLPKNTSEKENYNGITVSNTKLNTITLLQMCHAVTQTCSDLPSQVTLAIRLSYYENTPEDYQPRGYKNYDPVEPVFLKNTRTIEVGVTGTNYHFFKLVNKSCFNENFLKPAELQDQEIPKKKEIQDPKTKPTSNVKRELKFDEPEIPVKKNCLNSENPNSNCVLKEKSTNTTEISKTKDVNSQKVRCPCLSTEASEIMFCCAVCKFLVHSECFGVLQFDCNKKIRFYCHICHQPDGKPKSHDKVLTGLKNSSDQQKLALLRRFLKYCFSPNVFKISLKKMQKMAGPKCSKETMQSVLRKMREIEVVELQDMRKSFLIDKAQLSQKIFLYFYQLQYSNSQKEGDSGSETLKRHNPDADNFHTNKCRKSTVEPQIIGTQLSQTSNSQYSLQYFM